MDSNINYKTDTIVSIAPKNPKNIPGAYHVTDPRKLIDFFTTYEDKFSDWNIGFNHSQGFEFDFTNEVAEYYCGYPGNWIVFDDGSFFIMKDEVFQNNYTIIDEEANIP